MNRKEVTNMATTKKTYTPKELAAEIGIDPKVLRAYLRKAHTRVAEAKNTSWIIDEATATAARKAFTKNVAGSASKATPKAAPARKARTVKA